MVEVFEITYVYSPFVTVPPSCLALRRIFTGAPRRAILFVQSCFALCVVCYKNKFRATS